MFVFGHVGLTIGLLLLIAVVLKKKEIIYGVDLRIVAVLAMLPDIIDKILGHFFLKESLNNGRIYSHTLFFLIFCALVCFFLVKKFWWVYALPILTHQVFDRMWELPEAWFWPTQGWGFNYMDIDVWDKWLDALMYDPFVITTEILGFLVLLIIFIYFRIYRKDNFLLGLQKGRLAPRE